jgi:hypothetical protein
MTQTLDREQPTIPPSGRHLRVVASTGSPGVRGDSRPALSKVAWLPPRELGHVEWTKAGRRFGTVARCAQWWIGDWLRYGSSRWGEKYGEAARITGYDIGTLRNYASIAGQFNPSLRSDKLSWSHHALLAPFSVEERRHWIGKAEDLGLSVADLRIELRASKRRACIRPPEVSSGSSAPAFLADRDRAEVSTQSSDEVSRPLTLVCPSCGGKVPVDGA